MPMDHSNQQDKTHRKMHHKIFFTSIIILLLLSCKNGSGEKAEQITKIERHPENHKQTSENETKYTNCFKDTDTQNIDELLKTITSYCNGEIESIEDRLTNDYWQEFREFPCNFYDEAKKFNAIPDYEINKQAQDCDVLAIYFNYNYSIVDKGEEFSSEKTLILYLIKDVKGRVLLNGFGVAG